MSGGPLGIDVSAMAWIAHMRSPSITEAVGIVSELFGPWAVTVWTALCAMAFALRDATWWRAVALMAAVSPAGLAALMLKLVVARPRPPATFQLGVLETSSRVPHSAYARWFSSHHHHPSREGEPPPDQSASPATNSMVASAATALTTSSDTSTNSCMIAAAVVEAPPRTMPTNAPGMVTNPTERV